jgi:anti-sigma factor ChrR (cupin superfamily)
MVDSVVARRPGVVPGGRFLAEGDQMKNMLTALMVVVAGSSWAHSSPVQAAEKGSKGALLVPASEVKWNDVPNMTGVQMAAVDGDPAKGPSHFLLKFVGGFAAPLHHHSANHFVTVVSGTVTLGVGANEQKLPAGSVFSFSDKAKHTTSCAAGADCVLSVDSRGKWDVVMDGEKTAKK